VHDLIAARAGVSERTIFQHFPDREALLVVVAERQTERVIAMLKPIASDGPLEERNGHEAFRAFNRSQIERVFGAELERLGDAERSTVVDAAAAGSESTAWKELRFPQVRRRRRPGAPCGGRSRACCGATDRS
jgi:AcrR family transcriptional regulator